jgi:uncharacterized protein YdhG (YjbR/CyaY superfamily)
MRTGKAPKTVDEYLAIVPEPARTTLAKIRATIRAAAPKEATEGISYGMPMFKYKGMLVGFAAFSKHGSLFPGGGPIADLQEDLRGFPISKGTIQFPMDKPLSAALVKKLVKARVAENERKKKN